MARYPLSWQVFIDNHLFRNGTTPKTRDSVCYLVQRIRQRPKPVCAQNTARTVIISVSIVLHTPRQVRTPWLTVAPSGQISLLPRRQDFIQKAKPFR